MKKLLVSLLALFSTTSFVSATNMREKDECTQPRYKTQNSKVSIQIESPKTVVNLGFLPWVDLEPRLNKLFKETIGDSSYEERNFHFQVRRENWNSYCDWEKKLRKGCKYPIGLGSANEGAEGDRVDGVYGIYHKKLTIHNHTKKENESRDSFAYRFHGGKLDEKHLNVRNFYNLMVRAGFTEEDFEKGKYGYQDKVFVKPVMLQEITLPACFEEFKEAISSTLEKSTHPYVTLVFELSPHAPFTIYDLDAYDNDTLTRDFFEVVGNPAATILEPDEKRIYFCFHNQKRKMLDLHGMTAEEGFIKVKALIQEKFTGFEDECNVITGRGNHVNSNGTSGIMFMLFPKWMKDPQIVPFVKRIVVMEDGGYKVFLKKSVLCDLTSMQSNENPFEIVTKKLREVLKTQDLRLRIKVKDDQFYAKLTHFLAVEQSELANDISPFSLEDLQGELRLTLKTTNSRGAIISYGKEISEEVPLITPIKKPVQKNGQAQNSSSPKQKKAQAQRNIQPRQNNTSPQQSNFQRTQQNPTQPSQNDVQAQYNVQTMQNNAQSKSKPQNVPMQNNNSPKKNNTQTQRDIQPRQNNAKPKPQTVQGQHNNLPKQNNAQTQRNVQLIQDNPSPQMNQRTQNPIQPGQHNIQVQHIVQVMQNDIPLTQKKVQKKPKQTWVMKDTEKK